MNRAVEKGRDLDDAEARQVVVLLVKQRKDAIEQFAKGGRQDLVDKETAEIDVLEAYLPPGGGSRRHRSRGRRRDCGNGRHVAEGHRTGHEGGDGEARRSDRRRQDRQRAGARQARRRIVRFDARTPTPGAARPRSWLSNRLARSAGLAGVATLTSRVLGLARESVLAALFGAGNEMDAFLVAFRIPNLARDLFAEGAMSAAFVPTFTAASDASRAKPTRGGSPTTS